MAPRQLELDLDMDTPVSSSGFRLRKFELYNWGTFHGRVWSLRLDGENGLLTGDIGSGKSTFMDAMTTLLIPPNRAAYNKAAGAETRERSLRSYVEGHYKSERLEDGMTARPVALRGPGSYSVLLGCFHNESLDYTTTLAQVFWMRENEPQPDRFYVVSHKDLSIKEHFSSFGADMKNLRARLKDAGADIFDSFHQYRSRFSRDIGIPGEQGEHALELFHQAVSIKAIGDLSDFVRSHMLEPFDTAEKIRELIRHYDDLLKAHNSILTAKHQIGLLEPIVANCEKHRELIADIALMTDCLAALEVYFARHKAGLSFRRIEALKIEEEKLSECLKKFNAKRLENEALMDRIKSVIAGLGGDKIETIKQRIQDKTEELDRRRLAFDDYSILLESLGLPKCDGIDSFVETKETIERMSSGIDERLADNQNGAVEIRVVWNSASKNLADVRLELQNLRANRTNIGSRHISLRARMSEELGIPEADLPFAGELLRVRPEEMEWEGAAERILHNFGLSMLVPDGRYAAVSDWVEANHIGERLVYYRIKTDKTKRFDDKFAHIPGNSLVNKIETKPGNKFEDWLIAELNQRFNYACCDDMETFRRERRAVTRAGQIKSNDLLHEKDDRYRIDDRSRYVLGWENQSKIDVLENEERVLSARVEKLSSEMSAMDISSKSLLAKRTSLAKLETYRNFSSIDWSQSAIDIDALKRELDSFLAASDTLRELDGQLRAAKEMTQGIDDSIAKLNAEIGAKRNTRQDKEVQLETALSYLTNESLEKHSPCFLRLDELSATIFEEQGLTLENCDKNERLTRDRLTRSKDASSAEAAAIATKTVSRMTEFKREYAQETVEFDNTMHSAHDYAKFLERLQSDDLPRFESRFKELLNENTINEIASFQALLYGRAREITESIRIINKSLAGIDYSPGRYIKLEAHRDTSKSIRDFQREMKACTEDTFTGSDDQYSEAKFQNVCRIIERFKNRPDKASEDARWTAFVTDVRNWFSFTVSEIWRETGTEFDTSASSSGKSGGQKEKLAYTILAASLAYRFGLTDETSNHRTFRFVMIDEAFGRGSDESAQYALTLFKRLSFQLLIATPMQKIHIIEDFVSRVAFIHNETGCDSRVSSMTIREYRERKNAHSLMDRT